MNFYQQLQSATSTSQQLMMSAPVIHACRQGTITAEMYVAFLTQIYHHVSYTVPLLMAASVRVPLHQEWARQAMTAYIDAENDYKASLRRKIRACGVEMDTWRQCAVTQWIELMAAYFYDQIQRGNPMSIFGLMHVLEGLNLNITTSTTGQSPSRTPTNQTLQPCFATLMDNINDSADQAAIIHAAHVVYRLYGDMLRSLTEH
ncbi:iron-containing redox enzyme family protein [Dickeya chrysanthemi]|uniref:iron-containing redox enzyme family protein n=1 Tax=Dickeya chrysanthemi TaxID=556 RepID=UPI00039A47CD|nr:iron-containing redox enzyme family protein [Dickeya chrysanthemi]MBX9447249.1 biliverdin-producing heme oxygenase [Dickeya chrysanthemi]